jgi:uncharacterized protein YndB with AHSA1/START domain
MTSNQRSDSRILGSLRSEDGKGVVRIEDRYDTDIDDLWSAITSPDRLARWIGRVQGDLRPGGESSCCPPPTWIATGGWTYASDRGGWW